MTKITITVETNEAYEKLFDGRLAFLGEVDDIEQVRD